MTPLDEALKWHNMGVATIPIRYKSKRPVFVWKDYQSTLPTESDIKSWFKSRFTNLAVITGWKNLVIIDFDNRPIWELWQSWINQKQPELLKKTYKVETRRGYHIYLFVENPPERTIKILDDEKGTLIDIKAAGGYCLSCPSIHPTGHKYRAYGEPLNIVTIGELADVLPCIMLEKAVYDDAFIPEYKPSNNDIWAITPPIEGNAIQWIKQNRSIAEFFPDCEHSGGNRWYKVRCPFHDDNNASGWIDVQRNRFGCQAGCVGRGIDIVDFYSELKRVDTKTAIRELAR